MRKLLYMVGVVLLLGACKPSEKNYRLAYETAQQRAREGLDEGVYELMQETALPPMYRVAGDSVRVQRMPLTWYYTPAAVDSASTSRPKAYNVAVALYRMPTNARAHADEIAAEGYQSAVFQSGKEKYYVMAGLVGSLDSAAHLACRYTASHEGRFIGIPCPIALQPMH